MGTDKALLILPNGQSLIGHTAQVAQVLSPEVLVVTPWPQRYQDALPASVRLIPEVHPSSDPVFSSSFLSQLPGQLPVQQPSQKLSAGPLSGFATGWPYLSTDWCLLLACDLPRLDVAVLQRWWVWILAQSVLGWSSLTCSSSAQPQPMASLAPICTGGRSGWEPLCGYYHRSCLPSLNQQQSADSRAFQPWLSELCIARYDNVPSQMLCNCNTPADWAVVNPSVPPNPSALPK